MSRIESCSSKLFTKIVFRSFLEGYQNYLSKNRKLFTKIVFRSFLEGYQNYLSKMRSAKEAIDNHVNLFLANFKSLIAWLVVVDYP